MFYFPERFNFPTLGLKGSFVGKLYIIASLSGSFYNQDLLYTYIGGLLSSFPTRFGLISLYNNN